mmetsp:Transcript_35020/g.56027  ORF Transcript_35020/g.56027 Transcript_35020/m.56027 type:complete len:83 (-) Transcript_35020:2401-2649(-)
MSSNEGELVFHNTITIGFVSTLGFSNSTGGILLHDVYKNVLILSEYFYVGMVSTIRTTWRNFFLKAFGHFNWSFSFEPSFTN